MILVVQIVQQSTRPRIKGYPVLVAAVSDYNHKGRPIALSVTTSEEGDTFTFLLKALQKHY